MVWKKVPWAEEYLVSDKGRVRKVGFGELKLVLTTDGYHVVTIQGANRKVHRLVLEAFVGPCPSGLEGCHEDGNKTNNLLTNLRWGTRKSNAEDMVRHGTVCNGEDHHSAKLTEEKVIEIRTRYAKGGITQSQLATEYGVNSHSIYLIVKNKTWTHVQQVESTDFTSRRGNGWKRKSQSTTSARSS